MRNDCPGSVVRSSKEKLGKAWLVSGTLVFFSLILSLTVGQERSAAKVVGRVAGWAPGDILVQGSYAYLANGESGLQIIDVSDPSAPKKVSSLSTPGEAEAIHVQGDYAYLLDENVEEDKDKKTGLRIIDVSNPSRPKEVAFFDTPGKAEEVYVQGDYAYLADEKAGLRIIDVSNPSTPREVGFFSQEEGSLKAMGPAVGVYIQGSYAYLAELFAGLRIIDVSNPSAPREVGRARTPGWVYAVYVQDDYAYVIDEMDKKTGLRIIDVSNPSKPKEVAFFGTPGEAKEVHVQGSYAYIADYCFGLGRPGLMVVDISNPSSPKRPEWYEKPSFSFIPGEAWEDDLLFSAVAVSIQGDYAYVLDVVDGLYIINISRAASP